MKFALRDKIFMIVIPEFNAQKCCALFVPQKRAEPNVFSFPRPAESPFELPGEFTNCAMNECLEFESVIEIEDRMRKKITMEYQKDHKSSPESDLKFQRGREILFPESYRFIDLKLKAVLRCWSALHEGSHHESVG